MEVGTGDRFLRLLIEHGDDPAVLEATVRAARSRSEPVAALPEEETRRHVRALMRGPTLRTDAQDRRIYPHLPATLFGRR